MIPPDLPISSRQVMLNRFTIIHWSRYGPCHFLKPILESRQLVG